MDGFSVASNVITVIQAANAVIAICYNVRTSMRKAPWALTRVLEEVTALRNVLESIANLCSTGDGVTGGRIPNALRTACTSTSGPLTSCLSALSHLEGLLASLNLDKSSSSKLRTIGQAITWQFKDSEVMEVLSRIERCKTTLSLAIATDKWVMLDGIRKGIEGSQQSLDNVEAKIDVLAIRADSNDMSARSRSMTSWLSSCDPNEMQEKLSEKRNMGAGQWLFKSTHFCNWTAESSSFLWLSGFPGSGKSVLFSSVVTYVTTLRHKDNHALTAFFYCDFRDPRTLDVRAIIGTLLAQLLREASWIPEVLEAALRRAEGLSTSPKPSLAVMKEALVAFASKYDVALLIDALDECESRDETLTWLLELSQTHQSVKVFVVSRPELDIQEVLQHFRRIRLEDSVQEVDEDIQDYTQRRLASDPQLRRLSPSLKEDIVFHITKHSHGMFRWVQCQLDSVATLRTVKAIQGALSNLPLGLDETYARILRRVPKAESNLVRKTLCWLAFAIIPLTLEELYEAIAIVQGSDSIDDGDRLASPSDILAMCGSLVGLTDNGSLSLAHASVKEYLLSDAIQEDTTVSSYALIAADARVELAIDCLTYLNFAELATGPSPSAELYEDRLSGLGFLKYASTAWPYYAKVSRSSTGIMDLVDKFFHPISRPSFLSWVQVLNGDMPYKWNMYPKHATPLYYAASFGMIDALTRMLPNATDLNDPGSRFGGTALHAAVLRNHVDAVSVLLEHGADPDQSDFNHIAPLHTAAAFGYLEIISLLLKYGASPLVEDAHGQRPDQWAVRNFQHDAQRLLLGQGLEQAVPHGLFKGRNDAEGMVWRHPTGSSWYDSRLRQSSDISQVTLPRCDLHEAP